MRERRARRHRHAGVEVERLVAVAALQRHARRRSRPRAASASSVATSVVARSPSSSGSVADGLRRGGGQLRRSAGGASAGAARPLACAVARRRLQVERGVERVGADAGDGVDAERVEIDVAERVLVLVAARVHRRRRIGEQPPLGRRQLALEPARERRALVEGGRARSPVSPRLSASGMRGGAGSSVACLTTKSGATTICCRPTSVSASSARMSGSSATDSSGDSIVRRHLRRRAIGRGAASARRRPSPASPRPYPPRLDVRRRRRHLDDALHHLGRHAPERDPGQRLRRAALSSSP